MRIGDNYVSVETVGEVSKVGSVKEKDNFFFQLYLLKNMMALGLHTYLFTYSIRIPGRYVKNCELKFISMFIQETHNNAIRQENGFFMRSLIETLSKKAVRLETKNFENDRKNC